MIKYCCIIFISIIFSLHLFAYQDISDFNASYLNSMMAEELIKKHSFLNANDISIKIKNKSIFNTPPEHATFFDIELPSTGSILGKRVFSIIYFNDKKEAIGLNKLAIESDAKALAYFNTRKLKARDIITKNDIEQRLAPLTNEVHQFLLTEEQLIGKQAIRTITPQTLLSLKWVEDVPLIQKGDIVSVIISKQGYQIELQATALDSGMVGDSIRIKTILSDKLFKGEILHDKNVIVNSI